MAETNKDKWMAAIRAKNPGKTYENEDDMYADAMAGYAEKSGRLKRYMADDKKAMDVLSQNPDVQSFLAVILNGGSLGEAMSYLPNGEMSDEDRAAYDKENQRKVKARKDAEDKEAKWQDNWGKSAEFIKKWADENGRTMEETAAAFDTLINRVLKPLDEGVITPEFVEAAYRLHNYDNDIAASKQAGVMEGRNAAAGERAVRRKEGDGLPVLGSGGVQREEQKDPRSLLIGAMERNNSKHNIFRS